MNEDAIYDKFDDTPPDYTPEEMEAIFGYTRDERLPPDTEIVQANVLARRHWSGGWRVKVGSQEWFLPDNAIVSWRPVWASCQRGVEMHREAQRFTADEEGAP